MTKKLICPNCEQERLVEPVHEKREIEVKGEKLLVNVTLWRCLECKEEFEDPENPIDELDAAYREYRARRKMLQPEEVRTLRESYGLTQAELASLIGCSPATLSRYENGALQELSHDTILQSLNEPMNVYTLLQKSPQQLSFDRLKELKESVRERIEKRHPLYIYQSLESREPDIYSGNSRFSFDKYCAMLNRIISKCQNNGVYKTKLNKLLFYCDFLAYNKLGKSITGSCYTHEHYGPCPQDFQSLLGVMSDHGFISLELKSYKTTDAEFVKVNDEMAKDLLDETEKEIVDRVCEKFKDKTSKDLTEFSHKEKAYKLTGLKQPISYEYANYLQIK
jgi:putative zinc finger/helix-turn-helix YgiT family protein